MYTRTNVLTLQDLATIPVTTVWGAVDEAYNALSNPFRDAGVVKSDPLFQARASGEGVRTDITMWDALPYRESNISNDDPTQHSTPLKLNTKKWSATRNHRNISFSEMDLVSDFLQQDPLAALGQRLAVYKNNDEVAHMFAILNGLIAADKANGSKMTYSQATQGVSLAVLLTGLNKLGDASGAIKTFGMNSTTYLQLQLMEASNVYVTPSASNTQFGTLANRRILVDDRFQDATVGGKPTPRIIGMGDDLFHVGNAPASVNSVAVQRDESAGNGRGQSEVFFRWQDIVHPVGYSFEGTYASVGGPTFAELTSATAFVRNTDVKKIPLVVIEAPLVNASA